jgi:hypothetical protein
MELSDLRVRRLGKLLYDHNGEFSSNFRSLERRTFALVAAFYVVLMMRRRDVVRHLDRQS